MSISSAPASASVVGARAETGAGVGVQPPAKIQQTDASEGSSSAASASASAAETGAGSSVGMSLDPNFFPPRPKSCMLPLGFQLNMIFPARDGRSKTLQRVKITNDHGYATSVGPDYLKNLYDEYIASVYGTTTLSREQYARFFIGGPMGCDICGTTANDSDIACLVFNDQFTMEPININNCIVSKNPAPIGWQEVVKMALDKLK